MNSEELKFSTCTEYNEYIPVEMGCYPFLSKGMVINLKFLFGKAGATVTKIDGDEGECEIKSDKGDILIWLKRIDGVWNQSTTSVNKNALIKVQLV